MKVKKIRVRYFDSFNRIIDIQTLFLNHELEMKNNYSLKRFAVEKMEAKKYAIINKFDGFCIYIETEKDEYVYWY